MHRHAASPRLPWDLSCFLLAPFGQCQKGASSCSLWIQKALEILVEKISKTSPLQRGAQKLKLGFPAEFTTPSSSVEYPQPPELPCSCISWLFGKPRLLPHRSFSHQLPTNKELQSVRPETPYYIASPHLPSFPPSLNPS